MGPRPSDFDETLVKQSPTFIKWVQLNDGEKLRYACREFIKGHGDDSERLMRRIMIARRNNLKDHVVLKRARQITHPSRSDGPMEKVQKLNEEAAKPMENLHIESGRKRRPSTLFSDAYVAKEMDVPAVEATRSYRAWLKLPDGASFVYNQKYTKGKEGHDWLLKKNIWRRMRYRRENKKMVEEMRQTQPSTTDESASTTGLASQIVDQALLSTHAVATDDEACANAGALGTEDADSAKKGDFEVSAAVEAAMGVAESYAKSPYNVVHNPLEAVTTTAALDAAARLAAAAANNDGVDDDAIAAAEAAAQQQNARAI